MSRIMNAIVVTTIMTMMMTMNHFDIVHLAWKNLLFLRYRKSQSYTDSDGQSQSVCEFSALRYWNCPHDVTTKVADYILQTLVSILSSFISLSSVGENPVSND